MESHHPSRCAHPPASSRDHVTCYTPCQRLYSPANLARFLQPSLRPPRRNLFFQEGFYKQRPCIKVPPL